MITQDSLNHLNFVTTIVEQIVLKLTYSRCNDMKKTIFRIPVTYLLLLTSFIGKVIVMNKKMKFIIKF